MQLVEVAMTDNYVAGLAYLEQYKEVNGYEFYRDIFPNNERSDERHMDFSHPNAIYLYRDDEYNALHPERTLRRRVMYSDTWEQDYMDYVEGNPFTLCSGLAYRKNTNRIADAQRMHALIFDLDGVGEKQFPALFYRFGFNNRGYRTLPIPTYIVLSGNGVHIYYVFERPIDLYPNLKPLLKKLKYGMTTYKIWNKETSQLQQVQQQPISQGFRMVGSINEKYGTPIKAFLTGEKIAFEEFNHAAMPEDRILDWKPSAGNASKMYAQKWAGGVNNGEKLYKWWLKKSENIDRYSYETPIIKPGHRYYYMLCLAIYASKCCIPYERLKADMYEVFERIRWVEHDNELTEYDVKNALKAYSKDYYNFTIDDIEKLTDIKIDRGRRNGRKQEQHIKIMTAIRDALYPNGEWRGRPSAQQAVEDYQREHPGARKADCIRDTGLSKPTVYKWWSRSRSNERSKE